MAHVYAFRLRNKVVYKLWAIVNVPPIKRGHSAAESSRAARVVTVTRPLTLQKFLKRIKKSSVMG